VRVHGEAAHAGAAERHERKDALMAAVRMIAAIDAAALEPADTKLTVGLFEVTPNAPSVVPAEVFFSIDLRHPDNAVVDDLDLRIRELIEALRGPARSNSNRSSILPRCNSIHAFARASPQRLMR
jgi:beta-ureidopropionase / N-carbamoyl-L-amino-acid hydrolase